MADREKLVNIIDTACEGCAENLMQPYGAEVLADYLIANGVRISPWISVEDRLPDNEVAVIAYCKEDDHSWYAFRRSGLWWRPGERLSIKIFGTVTHWMPLPEPPKEE